jgi:tetratricopeptide (TPR) repeat protein
VALAGQAVELSRQLGPEERPALMVSLMRHAHLRASLDEPEEVQQSLEELQEAEIILEALSQDRFSLETTRMVKTEVEVDYARLANKQGRFADAIRHASEGLRLGRENGERWENVNAHWEWGEACLRLAEYDQAYDHYLAAERIIIEQEDYHRQQPLDRNTLPVVDSAGQSHVKGYLGIVALRLGDIEQAAEHCMASVRMAQLGEQIPFLAHALGLAAGIAAAQEERARAATLSGASLALYASTGRKPWEAFALEDLFPGWREGPDAAALQAAFEAGQAMSFEEAAAFTLDESLA